MIIDIAARVAHRFRRAMVGNSFDAIQLYIRRVIQKRYILEVSSSGTVQGNVQSCGDTLRFVSNDVHELSARFLTLGLLSHRHRVINKSEPIFRTEGKLICQCTVDFELEAPNPEEVFLEAQRALGIVDVKLEL